MGNTINKTNGFSMSAYTLKIIAIIAMLIDHIAWAFVPTGTILGQIMHIIGRITAPIMSYFISEGFYYTRSVKKYALRLGIFAIISHIPYYYFMNGQLPISFSNGFKFKIQTSVIYTLLLGLISLIIWNSERINKKLKILLIILICIIAIPGDWSFITVLWILFFGINHNDFNNQMSSFITISIPIIMSPLLMLLNNYNYWYEQIFNIGILLAVPLLKQYNGKPGGNKNSKWLFYIFYPLHLLVLGLIKYKL
ncbi:TraX protein [Keratinibaculum paraultunense]|uniref:TraX protein n=1 Tax=Keratinibaculum paraultunense TaxID=1278232 RepID=A0A4R3KZG5_9FIRM|nr:TraX family protein [Keratinibaculum paraultunense]QQY80137.1 hypothetical protein JL105_02005 [Keratinibaculum paraultunense]TCS91542.1 TraX protein [Keratinibaculum paraultunense]